MFRIISLVAICIVLGSVHDYGHAALLSSVAEESVTLTNLARTQASKRQYKDAENSYRKALSIDPLNTDAIKELIALLRKQGLASKVQLTIARLTTEQRDALGSSMKQLEAGMLQDQADLRFARGQTDDGIKYLERAVEVDPDDTWLHFKLASQYAGRHQLTKGRSLLDGHLARNPESIDALYAMALYLADHDDSGDALKYFNRIGPAQRTPEMISLQQRLMTKSLVPAAKSLALEGKTSVARKLLTDAEKSSAGNKAQSLAVALAWAEIGEVSHGHNLFNKIDTSDQDLMELGNDARSGLIKILSVSGKNKALRQLDKWAAAPSAMEISAGLHISHMYADIGEYARAKQHLNALLAAHPKDSYMLYDAWKIAERTGHLDDEVDYLKQLLIAEPYVRPENQSTATTQPRSTTPLPYALVGIDEFGSTNKIERDWKGRKLAALIDRRSPWVSAAIDVRNRTGTSGISEFHSIEAPLEYRTPWHTDDEVFVRTDLIKLNTGNVEPNNVDFGSMLLCSPACPSNKLEQAAQGASFTAGYQRTDFTMDIGTTPTSFPVSNIVGGIQYKGDLGPFGYSVEASRRPITASLLSYAGTIDPNTGKTWGGVVASGGRFGLSLDNGETFGFWSSVGVHNLTGLNVLTNRRLQFMAGEQWRVINEENRRLVIGLTGMYWDYSENAGEYTFGHGGYYSPHNYRSLSIPITYTARTPRFSYLLRASKSASTSQTRAGLFYPTDSALQALAGPTAVYTESAGGGHGYSLKAAWEYQVTPKLFAGGVFAIDRSDYYAPNQALVYLRYSIDHPGARPVFMPPEPIEATSQFY